MGRQAAVALALLVAIACLAGCKPPGPKGGGRFAAPQNIEAPGALVRSNKPCDPAADVPDADTKTLADGNREFACALYHELAQGEGNLVFSPFSISTAMAMAYAGARGRTAEQLAGALHFTLPPERLHPAFGRLCADLAGLDAPPRSSDTESRLHITNGLWAQRGLRCLEDFEGTLDAHYGAALRELDFLGDPEGSRHAINRAVGEATEGRIAELVPHRGLVDALLVVTDAVYFRAYWNYQFSEEKTVDQPFYTITRGAVTARMMHQTHSFGYSEGQGYQALSLPYYGGEQAMVVVLPRAGCFAAVEAALGAGRVGELLEQPTERIVNVAVPKFRFSSGADLVSAFEALGAPDAFSASADFSGITGSPDLYVEAVHHRAVISVNEKWTEAAAGTAIVWMGVNGPDEPVDFIANRPFLFFIVDRSSGAILFMGRVMDPTA